MKFPFPNIAPVLFPIVACAMQCGCQNNDTSVSTNQVPQQAINRKVDLARFSGDWYVIAHIPTFIERNAFNAVESYRMEPGGEIPTTFRFNKGGFDGPLKTYRPKGFVFNSTTNAEWRMQFVWPIKASYLITYLAEDYQTTIVGVPDRKYVWIMARTKTLPTERYEELVRIVEKSGHDMSKLRKVPQS